MPLMTDYEAGDVVLVSFPFTDQSQAKARPAVVVSSAEFHKSRNDVVLIPITSTAPRDSLETPIKNWKIAGLLYESTAKPVIMTVIKSAIVKKRGRLSVDDLAAISNMLRRALI